MLFSKKSLLGQAKNGFALLPFLIKYNPEIKNDEPVEIPLNLYMICTYTTATKKPFITGLDQEIDNSTKTMFTTLNKKGYEAYKEDLWKEFDNYQTNNPPRYPTEYGGKIKGRLPKEEYFSIIERGIKNIEDSTMKELQRAENKVARLLKTCKEYGLDYENFKKEREEARSKI